MNVVQPFPSQYFAAETEFFGQDAGEWGNDYALPSGTPVLAPEAGVIVHEESLGATNWGDRIVMLMADGSEFAVGHLRSFAVAVGQTVAPGQIIGESGGGLSDPNHGNSTGPHIEPQLINAHGDANAWQSRGNYVDPHPWLAQLFGGQGGPYVASWQSGLTNNAGNQPGGMGPSTQSGGTPNGHGLDLNPFDWVGAGVGAVGSIPGAVLGGVGSAVGTGMGAAMAAMFQATFAFFGGMVSGITHNTGEWLRTSAVGLAVAAAVLGVMMG